MASQQSYMDYGLSVTFSMTYLFWGEAFHVGALHDVGQVVCQSSDVGVDRHLVLPLKLCPHLAELCVRAGGGHDVVHDVNVDVVQHHAVTITGCPRHVIH